MHTRKPHLSVLFILFFPSFAAAQSVPTATPTIDPVSVSLCEILKTPQGYNGKEIQIRGKINLEFEDFSIYDLRCNQSPDVWLMFGGDVATPIMSMWGDTKRAPGKDISFSGVEYPLVKDASFDEFIKHVTAREKKRPAYRVTATLTGVFFSQRSKQDPRLLGLMPGYGHMGCCRLLIIKQISDVESKPIKGEDYNEKWSTRRERSKKP
jgi:hypothetical protein